MTVAGGGETAAVASQAVEAALSEFAIDLSTSNVASAGMVTVRNNGTMVHNIAVRDTELVSPDVAAGETTELDLSELGPGAYEIFCTIPGHTESGMSTTLTIGGDGAASEGATEEATDGAVAEHESHELTVEEGAAEDKR